MDTYMKAAMTLALKGMAYTNPNPMVGAVVVKDGKIISRGYHEKYGGDHAEVMALRGQKDLEGASLYVTLEPCCHQGQTPPCTDLIIASGIKDVIVGCLDPNPLVKGRGVQALRAAGIRVEVGVMAAEVVAMNKYFNYFISHERPYVILKYAMTLDGKISTLKGDSKWISGDLARQDVHKTRHQVMAIMVGIGTILEDDPRLTARIQGGKNPLPIILDSRGTIPLTSQVLHQKCMVCVVSIAPHKAQALKEGGHRVLRVKAKDDRVDLQALMVLLGQEKIDSILLEGGSRLNGQMLKQACVKEVQVYIGPKLIGSGLSPLTGMDKDLMSQALALKDVSYSRFGDTLKIQGIL